MQRLPQAFGVVPCRPQRPGATPLMAFLEDPEALVEVILVRGSLNAIIAVMTAMNSGESLDPISIMTNAKLHKT